MLEKLMSRRAKSQKPKLLNNFRHQYQGLVKEAEDKIKSQSGGNASSTFFNKKFTQKKFN